MQAHARWLLTVCLLAGCAGGNAETRGLSGDGAPVTVSLRVDALSADGSRQRMLKPSEMLHTGDKIALDVDVDRPASIYVVQALPDGKLDVLYSPADAQKLMPGESLRVPSGGQWMEPDGNTPEEDLFVVASMRPFARLEQDLCTSLKRSPCALAKVDAPPANMDLATRGLNPPPPPPPPPPSNMDLATRGIGGEGPGYSMRKRSDRSGVVVLPLVLRHQR